MSGADIRYFNGDEDGKFEVGRNHVQYDRPSNGLYVFVKDQFGGSGAVTGLDVADIPDIIKTLQAVYDEFEENKPKGPKDVAEALADFPSGTVIKFVRDYNSRYIKVGGRWMNQHGVNFNFTDWDVEEWPFTVRYQPNNEEEN